MFSARENVVVRQRHSDMYDRDTVTCMTETQWHVWQRHSDMHDRDLIASIVMKTYNGKANIQGACESHVCNMQWDKNHTNGWRYLRSWWRLLWRLHNIKSYHRITLTSPFSLSDLRLRLSALLSRSFSLADSFSRSLSLSLSLDLCSLLAEGSSPPPLPNTFFTQASLSTYHQRCHAWMSCQKLITFYKFESKKLSLN